MPKTRVLALVLPLLVALTGCSSQPIQERGHVPATTAKAFDPKTLSVQTRHSESVRIGDLSGLMVMVENTADIDIDTVRIQVSSQYFAGLALRKLEPEGTVEESLSDSKEFVFGGPGAFKKIGYLLTLAPTEVGTYPAEVTVLASAGNGPEKLVAIYDLATEVTPRNVVQPSP